MGLCFSGPGWAKKRGGELSRLVRETLSADLLLE